MFLEKLTINVGENNPMYIEIHSKDTPEEELRYGDARFEDEQMLLWYGADNPDATGWVNNPWNAPNYTGAIISMAAAANTKAGDVIFRVMNNDITFDEKAYLADNAEITDE